MIVLILPRTEKSPTTRIQRGFINATRSLRMTFTDDSWLIWRCNRQISHESSVNVILNDLVALMNPRWIRVVGDFSVRGNIKTIIFAEHEQPGYTGPRPEFRRYLPPAGL